MLPDATTHILKKCLSNNHNAYIHPDDITTLFDLINDLQTEVQLSEVINYLLAPENILQSEPIWKLSLFKTEIFDKIDLRSKLPMLLEHKKYKIISLWLTHIGPEKIWKSGPLFAHNCLGLAAQLQQDKSWEAVELFYTLILVSQTFLREMPANISQYDLSDLFPKKLPKNYIDFFKNVILKLPELPSYISKSFLLNIIMFYYYESFQYGEHGTDPRAVAGIILQLLLNTVDLQTLLTEITAHANQNFQYNLSSMDILHKIWFKLSTEQQSKAISILLDIVGTNDYVQIYEVPFSRLWQYFTKEQKQIFFDLLAPLQTLNLDITLTNPEWQSELDMSQIYTALNILPYLHDKLATEDLEQYIQRFNYFPMRKATLAKDESVHRESLLQLIEKLRIVFDSIFPNCTTATQQQFIANNFAELIYCLTPNYDYDPTGRNILCKYFHDESSCATRGRCGKCAICHERSSRLTMHFQAILQHAIYLINADHHAGGSFKLVPADRHGHHNCFDIGINWLIALLQEPIDPEANIDDKDAVATAVLDRFIRIGDWNLILNGIISNAVFTRVITAEQKQAITDLLPQIAHSALYKSNKVEQFLKDIGIDITPKHVTPSKKLKAGS